MACVAGIVLCVRNTFLNLEATRKEHRLPRAVSEGAVSRREPREKVEGLIWADAEDSDDGGVARAGSSRSTSRSNSAERVLAEGSTHGGEKKARRARGANSASKPATTLMLRNIPNRCSQRALISELEALNFTGLFDFVYVPLDHRTMSNAGYAFVNFVNTETASAAMKAFESHHFSQQKKGKRCVAASIAHIQGLEANMKHYERSSASNARLRQRRPLVITPASA